MRFEWDPVKAHGNLAKHGVSFDVAIQTFADPFALMDQDRIEGGEIRWRTLGMVDGHLLLVVAHTLWDYEDEKWISRRRPHYFCQAGGPHGKASL